MRRIFLAACAVIGVGGIMAASVAAFVPNYLEAGCASLASGSLVESKAFTPYEDRLTHFALDPIKPSDAGAGSGTVSGLKLDGMDASWATGDEAGRKEVYFASFGLDKSMTSDAFYARGGVLMMTQPFDPAGGPYAIGIQEQIGDRATMVAVGRFDAVLTWADPMPNGVRPHYVAWVDQDVLITLVAERPAEVIVNLAREIACA